MSAPIQRTLLVDDEPFATMALQEMLEDFPEIEVVGTCSNAVEALDSIQSLQPDLIFLDINMPEISGLTLAKSINSKTICSIIG